MKKETAPIIPNKENISLVEGCIKDIKTDNDSIREWFNGYAYRHLHRIACDLEIIKDCIDPTSSILEIGSIPLLLTIPMKKIGYNLTCLDLNYERFLETIRNFNIPTYQCDIEKDKFPIKNASYDVVLFNEVFEHLRINPIFTFREIRRIIKKGGVLYMSTPNFCSVEGLSNMLLENKGYALCGDIYQEYEKLEKHGHMGHVREYTTREVIEFLENVGFNVQKIIFRGETRSLGKFGKFLSKVFPSLRPFCTYVAQPA